MIIRLRHALGWRSRFDRTVRRSIIALIVTALLAFAVVATGTSIVARRIARADALAEALRTAQVLANTVFAPVLPAVMRGDRQAVKRLDDAVQIGLHDGSLVRVKVWKRDGTVIYSDDAAVIGKTYPLDADVAASIDQQQNTVGISNLTKPENVTEKTFYRLIEIYIPMTLSDGTRLAFETYATDARVVIAENQSRSRLVPFALLALLILLIAQLPVSMWLVRRVVRAQAQHSRLLTSALTASGRERRALARDLHDGVVQDLAGASYVIDALANVLPADIEARAHFLVETAGGLVKSSIGSLRSVMVDVYPPDLTSDGLHTAIDGLAMTLHATAGVDVSVEIELDYEPGPEIAATLYRCTRESLANIAKHAQATSASVRLTGTTRMARLIIRDDGVGLPETGIARQAEGHLGLQLLRDAATDLGGAMQVWSGTEGGTTVELDLPTDGGGRNRKRVQVAAKVTVVDTSSTPASV